MAEEKNKEKADSKEKVEEKIEKENRVKDKDGDAEEKKIDNEKKEIKKSEKKQEKGKSEAVVNAKDLPISTKHAVAICKFIKNKKPNKAVENLENVMKMKKPVPMKGELPHRKGKGIERGRFPIKASKQFVKILKQGIANAIVNGIDLEKAKIYCKANKASRPNRRFGRYRFKRTHVTIKLKIPEKNSKRKNKGREK